MQFTLFGDRPQHCKKQQGTIKYNSTLLNMNQNVYYEIGSRVLHNKYLHKHKVNPLKNINSLVQLCNFIFLSISKVSA